MIRDNLKRHFLLKARQKLFITCDPKIMDCGLEHHVYVFHFSELNKG